MHVCDGNFKMNTPIFRLVKLATEAGLLSSLSASKVSAALDKVSAKEKSPQFFMPTGLGLANWAPIAGSLLGAAVGGLGGFTGAHEILKDQGLDPKTQAAIGRALTIGGGAAGLMGGEYLGDFFGARPLSKQYAEEAARRGFTPEQQEGIKRFAYWANQANIPIVAHQMIMGEMDSASGRRGRSVHPSAYISGGGGGASNVVGALL